MNITPTLPDGYSGPIKQLTCRACRRVFYVTWTDYKRLEAVSYCHECSLIEIESRSISPYRENTDAEEVYATFKAYHQSKTHTPMEQIVAEIYQYSRYFTRMVLAREKDVELKNCFEDIKTLEVNVVYPFLLEVYADYEQKRLSHADFVAILKLIESYVFRRMIYGMYATGLNKVFATLAKEIDKEHYLESVQANLLQRSGSARFPRDEEFQAAFVVKDIYNFLKRRYLLAKLENYKWKEHVNIDEYTIEHILPQNQNLSPEWQAELGPAWQEVQARYHGNGDIEIHLSSPDQLDDVMELIRQAFELRWEEGAA